MRVQLVQKQPLGKGDQFTLLCMYFCRHKAICFCFRREPPPYGRRQNYIPRDPEDFGDGGAFPEIHVAQYPRGMGKPGAVSRLWLP